MAKRKKIFCFTHHDLDGLITYLVTRWAHPGYEFEHKTITGIDIRQDITRWLLNHNISDYEKVFFLDIDVTKATDLIDYNNVMLIDHHKSHVDNKAYTNAAPIIKEYPSACLLAYRAFKKIYNTQFTNEQKTLIVYGNDYDSYTNELNESKLLNIIFWNTQNAVESFIENYKDGFKPFTKEQLAICRIYNDELSKAINSLQVFRGIHADVDGECRVVVSAFADKVSPNDISDYLLKTYDADVSIVANIKSRHVSFRRPKDGTMRLDAFAKDIADGGGHEYSAGGSITPGFLEFTKTLIPV